METFLHVVIVAHLLNLVAFQVKPEQGLGYEGVVEPLQAIVGHVEPLQVVLRCQQAIQILNQVVVQTKGLQGRIIRVLITLLFANLVGVPGSREVDAYKRTATIFY